ncbi:cation:dicarboxylate symporter family transporter, partial [Pseudomonas sp. NPDC089530]|uniref:cation:dicarboxylate symporter family transporter n=1 Tax=Pseudomonas sp. NPDC089530 TaxID=3390651 RepID=UPI003D034A0A
MKKAKLSLAWQILIGLVLGIAIGALLNHFSAEKAWWVSNVLQPAGDIFIRLIKMIVIPIVISSLIVGIAGVGDAKKLGRIGLKTIIYFEIVTTIAILVGLVLANVFHPGAGIDMSAPAASPGGAADRPPTTPTARSGMRPAPTPGA